MANCERDWYKISTNWNISTGSFSSSISIESPILQQIENNNNNNNINNNDIKLPLILVPQASDSDPCQITISFTEIQEVQQVYVRSTARVYEIYSARSLRSSNDYLCTVRCGIATRDDEVLHATDVEPVCGHSKESNREHEKENCSSSEDDWVEVKTLDMPLQEDQLNSVRQKNGANLRTKLQDLYEATAQFSDSDACTSLTLRLLSLQTKDWISIDEIYIFVEPAETADPEAGVAPFGNSATTSLMSMLVPTLVQLSKFSNAQRQDLHAPSSSEKAEPEYQDIGSKVNHSTDFEDKLEPEIKEAGTEPPEVVIPEQESNTGQRHNVVSLTDVVTSRVELVLEQLVSRVSRIEDICLRFEENMLKPIKSMEQRLQLVEEKVQVLAKNSLNPKLPSYTKISAPEFSCGESNSSSFYTEGNENPSCEELELKQKDTTADRVSDSSNAKNYLHPKLPSYTRISAPEFTCGESNSSSFYTEGNENPSCGQVVLVKEDAMSDKVPYSSHSKFHPGLIISAPEFSCHDDEDDNDGDAKEANDDAIGLDTDCPQEKPRQALSIDDALAAALSGFLANTSAQPAHYTEPLTVKSLKFAIEEIGDNDMATKQNENLLVPPILRSESNGTNFKDGIVSSPSEGDSGQDKLVSDCVNCSRNEAELALVQIDDSHIVDSTGVGEPSAELANSVSVKKYILDAVSEDTEVEVGKGILENTVDLVGNDDSQTADSTSVEEPSDEATISVLETNKIMEECFENTEMESGSISETSIDSQGPTFSVDFELPILDVKFTSSEFRSDASSLEVLFDNISDTVVDASLAERKNDDEKIDAVSNYSWTDGHLLFDWGGDDATSGPSSLEGKAQDYSLAHDTQDNFPSLL